MEELFFLEKIPYLFLCFTGSLLLHAGFSLVVVCGLLTVVAFLVSEHGLLGRETFSGCWHMGLAFLRQVGSSRTRDGTRVPAQASRFLTTEPLGKSRRALL